MTDKPRIAVHKFASCDGCQLAFLGMGEDLLALGNLVDIVHFVEAGAVNPDVEVDIAFIEGSVSTPEDLERIKTIREHSRLIVTIGACATAGGLQALRNFTDAREWVSAIYAKPEYIHSLDTATPIAAHVKVDLEIWGCPVSGQQVISAIRNLLAGVMPTFEQDKVCLECKRQNNVCVMVTRGLPCMGPVTRTGCGALCPGFERDCYACFGPAENTNPESLARRFEELGLVREAVARRFHFITSGAPPFTETGERRRRKRDD